MSIYFGKQVKAEEEDGVRGYSLETNDIGDEDDDYFGYEQGGYGQNGATFGGEELLDENGENDKAPVMPSDYYDQVENFLRKEPPKIGDTMVTKDSKQKKKKKRQDEDEKPYSQIPTLPPVNLPRRQLEAAAAEPKPAKRKSSGGESKKPKAIDPQLLREAFSYTDQLLRNAVLEEANEHQLEDDYQDRSSNKKHAAVQQRERKTHSAPQQAADAGADRDYLFYGAPAAKGRTGAVNVVRNLKSKKKQQNSGAGGPYGGGVGGRPVHSDEFFVKKEDEVDLKRNPLNFDELVSNFQNGVTLERLRKELEDSKNSLKQSKSAIRNLMQK